MHQGTSLLIVALLVAACAGPRRPSAAVIQPAQVTLDQFQSLRWLEGTWRGSADGSEPFYESYVYLNDSIIQGFSYTDSTLAEARDSNTIAWSATGVIDSGAGLDWVATHLDSVSARFEPTRGGRNSFTWRMNSRDTWTAELEWPDTASHVAFRTYRMDRLGN